MTGSLQARKWSYAIASLHRRFSAKDGCSVELDETQMAVSSVPWTKCWLGIGNFMCCFLCARLRLLLLEIRSCIVWAFSSMFICMLQHWNCYLYTVLFNKSNYLINNKFSLHDGRTVNWANTFWVTPLFGVNKNFYSYWFLHFEDFSPSVATFPT